MEKEILMFAAMNSETPDILQDILSFFCQGTDIDLEKLFTLFEAISSDQKRKLCLVTERLEFIDHLMKLRNLLLEHKTITEVVNKGEYEQFIYNVEFHSMEFSGVDNDIESICIYLMLTCIDTVMGKPQYKEFSTWLTDIWEETNPMDKVIPVDFIKKSTESYYEEYGVGRHFKRAIRVVISESLRERIFKHFAISKLDDGMVNLESYNSWVKLSDSQKVKKFSDYIFKVRNDYTHVSHRTFLPNIPVQYVTATNREVIISLVPPQEDNLLLLLRHIVIDLVRKELINLNG